MLYLYLSFYLIIFLLEKDFYILWNAINIICWEFVATICASWNSAVYTSVILDYIEFDFKYLTLWANKYLSYWRHWVVHTIEHPNVIELNSFAYSHRCLSSNWTISNILSLFPSFSLSLLSFSLIPDSCLLTWHKCIAPMKPGNIRLWKNVQLRKKNHEKEKRFGDRSVSSSLPF